MAGEVVGEAVILLRTVDQGVESQVKRSVDNAVTKAKADVKIGADTREVETKVGGLRGMFATFATEARSRLEAVVGSNSAVTRSLGQIEGAASKTGVSLKNVAVGATLAAGALLAIGTAALGTFMRVAGQIDDLQDVMGGTAEQASRLRNISNVLGVDVGTLGSSMFKLSQNIERNGEVFDKWGVTIARGRDGTVDLFETLLNLSDAYNSIEDPQQRNVFLMETFGRSGKALIDVLEQGREALEKFGAVGPILKQEQIDRARDLKIELKILQQEAEKLAVSAGGTAVAALSRFNTALKGIKDDGRFATLGGFLRDLIGPQDKATQKALDHARAMAEAAVNAEEEVAKLKLLRETLDELAGVERSAIDIQLALVDGQIAMERAVINVDEKTRALTAALRDHGEGSLEAREAELALRDARNSQIETIKSMAEKMAEAEVNQIRLTGAQVDGQQEAEIYKQKLLELAGRVEEPLRSQILALAQNIRDIPDRTAMINADTGRALSALESLNQRFAESSVKTITVYTRIVDSAFPAGPAGRQHGGPVRGGNPYIVGEAGPELFVPNQSGTIVPNNQLHLHMTNHFGPGSNQASVERGLSASASLFEGVLHRWAAGAGTRG